MSAYHELREGARTPEFPSEEIFLRNVEHWKQMYERDPPDMTIKEFLQRRLAAVIRLGGSLGPATVLFRPGQTETRTEIETSSST